MTSPRVEKQRQVVCTNSQAAKSKAASSITAPLLSFKNTQNNTGLSVEHTTKPNRQYVKSYVRVISKDGKTYNFNATLEKRINNITAKLQKAEKENGLIGKAWSWTKNTIGFGDSSNKVKQIQANERKLLAQFNSNEKTRASVFKQLTGCEYNEENLEKFIKEQIKLKSEITIEKYKEGQEMAVDVVADVGAGIAAGVALAAAPVTGGASLLLAAGVGGVTKLGIKATSAGIRGKDYSGKDILKDLGTGAITGLLTPVTMGLGGAVGNVSTRVGARVFGQSAAGKVATKVTTFIAREGTVGAIFGGGAEGLGEVGRQGYHVTADGEDFDLGTIYEKTKEGAIGGAVAGVLMNGGIKGVEKGLGKLTSKEIFKIDTQNRIVKMLKSCSTTNDARNSISIKLTSEVKKSIEDKYGKQFYYFVNKRLKTSISQRDIDNISLIMTKASEVMNISNINIQDIVLVYNTIKNGNRKFFNTKNMAEMTPEKAALIMSSAKQSISKDQLWALMFYKGNSYWINNALSGIKEGTPASKIKSSTLSAITHLKELIDSQIIPARLSVVRTEGYGIGGNSYGCLNSVKINGTTLDKAMKEAVKKGKTAIHELENQINFSHVKPIAQNERFTSTSVIYPRKSSNNIDWKAIKTFKGKVLWELDIEPKTKGIFVDGFNFQGNGGSEAEIVLQAASYFEISNISWDKNIKNWIVKARVFN